MSVIYTDQNLLSPPVRYEKAVWQTIPQNSLNKECFYFQTLETLNSALKSFQLTAEYNSLGRYFEFIHLKKKKAELSLIYSFESMFTK
jgi:hypothetical protein